MQIFKVILGFFQLHQYTEEPSLQQISYLFVFYNVRGLKKRITLNICILSCFVPLESILFNKNCYKALNNSIP